jgi:hypothetical protein
VTLIKITPTVYPDDPRRTLTQLGNPISEDREFGHNTEQLSYLINLLHGHGNLFEGNVSGQLTAELVAGRALMGAPKLDRGLAEILLFGPLEYVQSKAEGTNAGNEAKEILKRLRRCLSDTKGSGKAAVP